MKKIIVTGGAGFIGSAVCRYLIKEKKYSVLNIDKLTYAGVPETVHFTGLPRWMSATSRP